jgi:hypothetical protein
MRLAVAVENRRRAADVEPGGAAAEDDPQATDD